MSFFKHIPLFIMFLAFSFFVQAQDLSDEEQALEDQIVEMVVNRTYPGGLDEDDLTVQPQLTSVQPHLTAATLQWRTLNAINRQNASEKKSKTTSEE